jgi:diguanylate cyclase (GGDEF)-like protein/PAS domain S-box-containing protein
MLNRYRETTMHDFNTPRKTGRRHRGAFRKAFDTANWMNGNEAARLRAMFEQAPGFIAIVQGADHVYEVVNQAYYQLVGHKDLLGRPVREAVPELEAQGYVALADEVYASGKPFVGRQMRVNAQLAPGGPVTERYVDFVFQPLFGSDGKAFGVFVQGHDVTDQKLALEALHTSNERWQFAIEGARDGVWDLDLRSNEHVVSNRYKEILGYTDENVLPRFEDWISSIRSDDRRASVDALQGTVRGGPPYHIEYRLRCKNGNYKWVLSRGVVVARDEAGHPLRLTGTLTDVSEKKQTEEIIWRHASFDQLTGLPNRRLFRDRLEQEVRKAHREGSHIALLFIDLDRFKEVNDLRGHDAGDRLLTQVGHRLTTCVRSADTVARLGGDEFTIILTGLHGLPHVEQTAQKIIAELAKPFQLEGECELAHISASAGVTLCPSDGTSSEELMRNADQAMYAAKQAGRNQFRFFTKSMQEDVQRRMQLLQDLRGAMSAKQLQVYYQPIVDLSLHEVVKAEALIRWNHPKHGFVSPAQFIPLAEESGLIHEIGDWVFEEAATWSERWGRRLGKPFQISVNCSPVQILARSSVDWDSVLKEKGLPPHSIVVEITEGVLLNASANVVEVLYRYRDAGIQVALDDFGTGYSSLAYLKQFDIDYLKIDRSFVRDIEKNECSRAIAESIIAMAHKLGMKVIAEGIEKPEQEAVLRSGGCDYGQGFLFSEAIPPQAFEQLLVNQGKAN